MEDETKEKLTDIREINFIELKKFRKSSAGNNEKLERWLSFINNPNDREVNEMAKVDKDIMKAQEILSLISSDEEAKQLAEMRQKAIMDKVSFENAVKRKYRKEGIEEGKKEEKLELANKLLDVLNDEVIAEKVGLPIETIRNLRNTK